MITIFDGFGYELPIKERYRLIKEMGFEGVLLRWSKDYGRINYDNKPQILRDTGLFIENIHTPFKNQNNIWLDNLEGEALTDCYLQCVIDCAKVEIPTMVVHVPNDDKPYNELGLDRIKSIAEKAESLGVNVAFENLRNLTNLMYVLDHVDSQRVGFCYDCGHHYRYYPDKDLLGMYGTRLMAIHLHDNNGSRMQHGLPYDGTLDWPMIMEKIEQTGYSGSIAIEALNWDYEDLSAEEFLKKAYRSAKKLEAII